VLTASHVPVTKNESVKYFTAFELDLWAQVQTGTHVPPLPALPACHSNSCTGSLGAECGSSSNCAGEEMVIVSPEWGMWRMGRSIVLGTAVLQVVPHLHTFHGASFTPCLLHARYTVEPPSLNTLVSHFSGGFTTEWCIRNNYKSFLGIEGAHCVCWCQCVSVCYGTISVRHNS